MATKLALRPLVGLASGIVCLLSLTGALAYSWGSYSTWQVISSFSLSGGSTLNGTVGLRFDQSAGSFYIETWGNNIASRSVTELYVYTAGQDRCHTTDAWTTWATADNISYGTSSVATDSAGGGIGTYLDCNQGSNHQYKSYLEDWGVDPAPDWQWTSGYHIS